MAVTRTFATHYLTEIGVLMVIGEDYVTLIRVRDGMCDTFTDAQLGFPCEPEKPLNRRGPYGREKGSS